MAPQTQVSPPLCPGLPPSPDVNARCLTWALSTGLPAEDGDHHLRGEGTAAGQRLRQGAEYVPGPLAPRLVPFPTSCTCHHSDQRDLPPRPPDTCSVPASRGSVAFSLKPGASVVLHGTPHPDLCDTHTPDLHSTCTPICMAPSP